MIQFTRNDSATCVCSTYLNLYDGMTNSSYAVLVTVTSQLTGKSKTFIAPTNYANKDRYVWLLILVVALQSSENLSSGNVFLGSTDYPLGFYDVVIYQNSSAVNLDPSGLTKIWNGLMNLTAASDAAPVTYSEYTTNDSDTESVYITF